MGQAPCGLGAIELPMFAFPRLDAISDLFGGLRVPEEVAVFSLDDAFLDEEVEVDRLSPIALADENDGDRADLARLAQRQDLEEFVQRAEAAWEGD
jgi:hypothetical protein